MEKKDKKSVKSRIVSAAWQLFYEKGYNETKNFLNKNNIKFL